MWQSGPPAVMSIGTDSLQSPSFRTAEEATGVHIDMIGCAPDVWATQFSIMIAGGEYPDLIGRFGPTYTGGYEAGIADGIIIDMKELIPTYAPDYWEILNEKGGVKDCTTDSGYMPAMGEILVNTSGINNGPMVNEAWLAEAGFDTLKTYDDYEQYLTYCKSEHNASLLMHHQCVWLGNYFCAGFGVMGYQNLASMSRYGFYQVDGTVKHGWIEDGFKDYLTLMNDWWEKGLLDQDIIYDNSIAYASTGEYAYVYQMKASCFYGNKGNIPSYERSVAVEGTKFVAVPDPVLKVGDTTHFQFPNSDDYGISGYTAISISTQCEDPVLATQYLNYWFTDEGFLAANYGEEGYSYEMVNGQPQYTDVVLKAPNQTANDYINSYMNVVMCCLMDPDKLNFTYTDAQLAANSIWSSNNDTAWLYPAAASLTADEGDEFSTIMGDVNTYGKENIVKFIIGEKPLDEFDAFADQLVNLGMDRCIEIYQAAYNRYMNR